MPNKLLPEKQTDDRVETPLWDWADGRTWLIVAAIIVAAILMAAVPYVMPQGQKSEVPAIHTY